MDPPLILLTFVDHEGKHLMQNTMYPEGSGGAYTTIIILVCDGGQCPCDCWSSIIYITARGCLCEWQTIKQWLADCAYISKGNDRQLAKQLE
jgi:hypothetical protein